MTNNQKSTPDNPDPRNSVKPDPLRRAQLIVGLANLLLQVAKWTYFLITGEWPGWPQW